MRDLGAGVVRVHFVGEPSRAVEHPVAGVIVHAGIGLRIARVDAGGVGAGVEVKRRPAHGIAACDPAAGVEQPAACVVHGGAVAQQSIILLTGVQLAADSRVGGRAGKVAERRHKVLKPDRCCCCQHLLVARQIVDDVVGHGFPAALALVAAPPAGVGGVIAHAHILEVACNAVCVAEGVIIVPYRRAEEFPVAVLVLLVGEEGARNTGIPVLAQLIDQIELCRRIQVDQSGDRGGRTARGGAAGREQGVELGAHIFLYFVIACLAGVDLGRLDGDLDAAVAGDIVVVAARARVYLRNKRKFRVDGAVLVQIFIAAHIGDKAACLHLFRHLVHAPVVAVHIKVHKPRIGGVGHADRVGQIIQNAVARQRVVLIVGQDRIFFVLCHTGYRDLFVVGDVVALFRLVP